MARRSRCKVCHARGAEIGKDGRCCGCRMALWATQRGMMYGSLMGRLYQAGVESAPTRGPWIEMPVSSYSTAVIWVGPHTGAVD